MNVIVQDIPALRVASVRNVGPYPTVCKAFEKLHGWFEYFKHAYPTALNSVDGWVRMRLRSILRKRSRRKGRGRGTDHQRWPNAYFTEHGLFSCVAARAEAVSP